MNSATPAPMLIDERQARHFLGGLSTKTLYNLRKSAGLPYVKIGERTLYSPEDLAKWIESRKQK